jgi:hypothetical protein
MIQDEFRDVIYDQNANPTTLSHQLEEINQDYFVNSLQKWDDISDDRIIKIAEQLINEYLSISFPNCLANGRTS